MSMMGVEDALRSAMGGRQAYGGPQMAGAPVRQAQGGPAMVGPRPGGSPPFVPPQQGGSPSGPIMMPSQGGFSSPRLQGEHPGLMALRDVFMQRLGGMRPPAQGGMQILPFQPGQGQQFDPRQQFLAMLQRWMGGGQGGA